MTGNSWGRGPYYARDEQEQPPTLAGGLPPIPPVPLHPPWWKPRHWRDAAWACWSLAGLALTALAITGTVMLAEVAVAFFRYLLWGG